jgi:hypothetical protein
VTVRKCGAVAACWLPLLPPLLLLSDWRRPCGKVSASGGTMTFSRRFYAFGCSWGAFAAALSPITASSTKIVCSQQISSGRPEVPKRSPTLALPSRSRTVENSLRAAGSPHYSGNSRKTVPSALFIPHLLAYPIIFNKWIYCFMSLIR